MSHDDDDSGHSHGDNDDGGGGGGAPLPSIPPPLPPLSSAPRVRHHGRRRSGGRGNGSDRRMLEAATTARVVAFVEQWLDEPAVEALVVLHRGYDLAVLDTVMLDGVHGDVDDDDEEDRIDERPSSPEVVARFGASIGRHVLTRSRDEPMTYALLAQGPGQRVLAQEQLIVERATSPLTEELSSIRLQKRQQHPAAAPNSSSMAMNRAGGGDGALLLQAAANSTSSSTRSSPWALGLMAPHPRPMATAAAGGAMDGWGLGGGGGGGAHAAVAVPFLESATSQGVLRQGMRHHEKMAQLYHRSVGAVMASALKREDMLLDQVDKLRVRTAELDRELDEARYARVEEHARRQNEAIQQHHAKAVADLEDRRELQLEEARQERDLDRTAVIRNALNKVRQGLLLSKISGEFDVIKKLVGGLSIEHVAKIAEVLPPDKAGLFIQVAEGLQAGMVRSDHDQQEEAYVRQALKAQRDQGQEGGDDDDDDDGGSNVGHFAAALAELAPEGPMQDVAATIAATMGVDANVAPPAAEVEAAAASQRPPPPPADAAPAAPWPAPAPPPPEPYPHRRPPPLGLHGQGAPPPRPPPPVAPAPAPPVASTPPPPPPMVPIQQPSRSAASSIRPPEAAAHAHADEPPPPPMTPVPLTQRSPVLPRLVLGHGQGRTRSKRRGP